jgi:hypothetical protein
MKTPGAKRRRGRGSGKASTAGSNDGNRAAAGGVTAEERPTEVSTTPIDKENENHSNEKKVEQWKDGCRAKELLRELLTSDKPTWIDDVYDPDDECKSIEIIRSREPLFAQYKKENFRQNFRTLKDSIDLRVKSIKFDQEAYDKEQKKWPIEEQFATGGYKWGGSRAQALLKPLSPGLG